MHKTVETIRTVLFWVVLVVSVMLIALSFLPRCLGFSSCSIQTDDLLPVLHRGDLALAKPILFEDIQNGDLLTFRDPKTGEQFTREVAQIWNEKQELVTKAPQSETPDPYTTAYRCVVGRVVHTVRFAGVPSMWLHSMLGKVLLALLYIIWLAVEAENFAAGKRREKSNA